MRAACTLLFKVSHTMLGWTKEQKAQITVEMSLASQKTDKITDVAHWADLYGQTHVLEEHCPLWASPINMLCFDKSEVDRHLHNHCCLPNTKYRYSLTLFLHIHWPSWSCWLKVSGAEILMSIAPSSCLFLTANWQRGIKLKRGGQLFFPSPWLTHRLKIFLKGIPGSVCSWYKATSSHVRGRRGLLVCFNWAETSECS